MAVALATAVYFLWKFAQIILVFEDDLSTAINNLNDVEDKMMAIIKMQMFFDSPEVKQKMDAVLDQVKICRVEIQAIIQRFTERSKQQYTTVWEEPPEDYEEQMATIPQMPGQPPGSPNPLDIIGRDQFVMGTARSGRR
jgi:hypothetical protein